MDTLIRLIADYGLLFVFLNILLQQLGAPLPGYPLLLVTGALSARGQLDPASLLAVAVGACLIADTTWYALGAGHGRRVLRTLCKISLSPDGCVRQTESIFTRFGAPSLLVAKFIPGFASVATAMAGAMRVPRRSFFLFDAAGALLWSGLGLTLGWLFSPAIERILAVLARLGEGGLMVIAVAVLGFVAFKGWQRYRFNRQLRMARLTVQALADILERGKQPVIVDVRSQASQDEGRIPGAIVAPLDQVVAELAAHPKDSMIVVYCACPNDASAVAAARKLLEHGYLDVHPLAGGIDAWTAAGRSIEPPALSFSASR